MLLKTCTLMLFLLIASQVILGEPEPILRPNERTVCLGDSNTYAGGYIELLELCMRIHAPKQGDELLNLGLSSEGVTGLTEPDHPFPRPNLHERLERVLTRAKPQLVIACYGMNDGIYAPFNEERFKQYQQGIQQLRDKVLASGTRLVLLTPPPFEPSSFKGKMAAADAPEYGYKIAFQDYDSVMGKYAAWMQTLQSDQVHVIDIYQPIKKLQAQGVIKFTSDGVHFSEASNMVIAKLLAQELLNLTAEQVEQMSVKLSDAKARKLVKQHQQILRDAWLTHTEHKRPGVAKGLPLPEASAKAAVIGQELIKFLKE